MECRSQRTGGLVHRDLPLLGLLTVVHELYPAHRRAVPLRRAAHLSPHHREPQRLLHRKMAEKAVAPALRVLVCEPVERHETVETP